MPLTIGKMYDVLEIRMKRIKQKGELHEIEGIRIINDLGEERWYMVRDFALFLEAKAGIEHQIAAGAGQGAAQSATPDGSQIYVGIDIATGAVTANFTPRELAEIGKQIAKGFKDGIGLNYGA